MLSPKTALTLGHQSEKTSSSPSLRTLVTSQLRRPKRLAAVWLGSLALAWAHSLPSFLFCLAASLILYIPVASKSRFSLFALLTSKLLDAAYYLTYLFPLPKFNSSWLLLLTGFLDRPPKSTKPDKDR